MEPTPTPDHLSLIWLPPPGVLKRSTVPAFLTCPNTLLICKFLQKFKFPAKIFNQFFVFSKIIEFACHKLKSTVSSSHSLHFSDLPITPNSGLVTSSPRRDDDHLGDFGAAAPVVGTVPSRFPFSSVTNEVVTLDTTPTAAATSGRLAAELARATYSSFVPASTNPRRQPIQCPTSNSR